ncbi:hypothetical protein [Curtobacterium sp. MCBD17_032]|uniref:arsenate reductase/protein-tyrosine-phosphatase family protein n=1 Tax=Curtobacterium sp. MCBD17_032 TaxID=2175659 RepID=UPI000DA702E9|nr:hypothetical protein [Curtobacterium sp. MCBD17_032]PZE86195.1 hypothetical protein DEI91_03545 [Curtobacterium sp. MCBD17_032]
MTTWRITFVCEGNVCRSPYAALTLRSRCHGSRHPGVEVSSAGTHASPGAPADPMLRALVRPDDLAALERHRAHPIAADALRRQHLVVTMTRAQRSAVLDVAPAVLQRVFTVAEVIRMTARLRDDASRIDPALAVHELLARGRPESPARSDDDVPDPVGGDAETFRRMARTLDTAVDGLVLLLRSVPAGPTGAAG